MESCLSRAEVLSDLLRFMLIKMLNPVECFIEGITLNTLPKELVQEVQQFLDFQQGAIL